MIYIADKTGTLTQNKITVVGSWTNEGFSEEDLIFYASLCSKKENEDPIDLAVFRKLESFGPFCYHDGLHASIMHFNHSILGDKRGGDYEEVNFVPFDALIRRTEAVHFFHNKHGKKKAIRTMKGAVSVVASFCKLSKEKKKEAR